MKMTKKIFTLCMVLSPLLSLYGVSESSITFMDISLIILIPLMTLVNIKVGRLRLNNIYFELLPFLLFIVIQFLLLSIIVYDRGLFINIGLRTFRYCLYLGTVVFFAKDYFEYEYGIKVLKYFAIFATTYLFAQLILLRGFNFYLKGYLPFLPVMRESLITFSESARYTEYTRVRSIFGEISQYAITVSAYLSCSLFSEHKLKSPKVKIYLTFGLLLSASTLGILNAFIIWIMWLFILVVRSRDKINPKAILIFNLSVFLALLYYFNSSFYQLFTSRFDSSASGRFAAYFDYFINNKDMIWSEVFFGIGMNTHVNILSFWYPSIAKIWRFFGVVGSGVFLFRY